MYQFVLKKLKELLDEQQLKDLLEKKQQVIKLNSSTPTSRRHHRSHSKETSTLPK